MLHKSDGLRCRDNYLDGLIKNANSLSASRRRLKAGEITLTLEVCVREAYKRCFIRHITCKMTSRQCSFRNTVIYHVLIFKRALRAHVYSTKPFGKVLILWWVATNKCMYVKHIPQHNNLNPTSLLITLTVFVAGATNQPDTLQKLQGWKQPNLGYFGNPALGRKGMKPALGRKGTKPALGRKGTNPALGRKGTKLALGRKGTKPALGRKGTKPALGRKGTNPVLGRKGTNPVLGRKGTKPTLGRKGTNPALGRKGTNSVLGWKGTNPVLGYFNPTIWVKTTQRPYPVVSTQHLVEKTTQRFLECVQTQTGS